MSLVFEMNFEHYTELRLTALIVFGDARNLKQAATASVLETKTRNGTPVDSSTTEFDAIAHGYCEGQCDLDCQALSPVRRGCVLAGRYFRQRVRLRLSRGPTLV